ncbi:NAD(P) transhydrogenase subunit alpha [Planctomycetes bacterium Poly30]|uniref:NAD(P) transhydrogenase subunit alpha n=1 Tax=Saltatorellus ferox TaxID=2528018 RepID=A0A518F0H1_9BACT|nr:NAD(P) transhydrogenase subunit alpha [Planctomycetes bacterium Poly30]
MRLGIPVETYPLEQRVAASPAAVERYRKLGFEVAVARNAGADASFPDSAYEAVGATIVDQAEAFGGVDVVLKVRAPRLDAEGGSEVDLIREGATLISFVAPAQNEDLLKAFCARNLTVLAMDQVPRITRAQSMDALSSMANIAGYRAVVEASNEFGSFFTGQFTAAGKVPPAKVLVIGAGVAGLAAIGAARGLGAIIRAFDTRESVRDQIKSLGGEFLTVEIEESGDGGGGYAKVMSPEFIEAEMALFREQAKDIDIVITTALIPGKKAPLLWTRDMIEIMKPGSVVVDLAAENGGNCEVTVADQKVVVDGVTVIGYTDLTSRMANVASDLYGTNLAHLLKELGGAEGWNVDHENEVLRGALVAEKGEVMWPAPKVEPKAAPAPAATQPPAKPAATPQAASPKAATAAATGGSPPIFSQKAIAIGAALALLWVVLRFTSGTTGATAASIFVQHLTVFVLACFVGWQVIWSVTAALHTPLMSVTNAISGIIVIGGILMGMKNVDSGAATFIGALAVLFATINIVGGFQVTRRMLRMFHK